MEIHNLMVHVWCFWINEIYTMWSVRHRKGQCVSKYILVSCVQMWPWSDEQNTMVVRRSAQLHITNVSMCSNLTRFNPVTKRRSDSVVRLITCHDLPWLKTLIFPLIVDSMYGNNRNELKLLINCITYQYPQYLSKKRSKYNLYMPLLPPANEVAGG